MAAAIKALNTRIRANPVSDYLCSTHFWGPASNFGIPLAAVMDTQKDADIISGRMTLALSGYSAVFMRYSMMVTPKNYLLFGCHVVNFGAQITQGYRFINYWHLGGRETDLKAKAEQGLTSAKGAAKDAASQVEQGVKDVVGEAKKQVEKITR